MKSIKYKHISNFERFLITTDGQIIRTEDGYKMKTHIRDGYEWIQLNCNGIRKYKAIHRIMAETFLPNPKNKRTVNHKDSNGLHNTLKNLEWATDSENIQHCYDAGRRPNQTKFMRKLVKKQKKFTLKQAREIRNRIKSGETYNYLAKKYKVHRETIGRVNRGIGYKDYPLRSKNERN
jgi:uncharacterized protein YerC